MKKEYFWFLTFILAAAVVTGSTLGMITNFKYISQHTKARLQEQKELELEKTQKTNNLELDDPFGQTKETGTTQSSTSSDTSLALGPAADNATLVISNEEKNEIDAMLNTLDDSTKTDFGERIKHFQLKNALPSTGIIDLQTLNLLINQAKIEKAGQRLAN